MRERRWLLLLLVAVHCTVSAWALPLDDKTVTLNLKNVSMEVFLDAVKKQSGANLLYNVQMFKDVAHVTVSAKNEKWETVLKRVLTSRGFEYVLKDDFVVIRQQKKDQQSENRIRGTVVDSNGEPIPGASVMVKGTRTGTSTNIEGVFTLDVNSDKVALEVSFIGMKKQTLQVDATRRKQLEITLADDVKTLDDVVVTGYSNVRKSSFTGSSTQITGDELRKVSQTNIIGAIQSFDPSFRIVDNTQFGSDPNALPEMYIRGRSGFGVKDLDKDQLSKSNLENNPNLPTFIMDGFEVSIEKIYDLDPTRIESLTVLKDAAATAMYGSRAANGVVVITTVAPKAGEVRVSYNFAGTLEMPDLSDYNRANAAQKLEIERLAGLYEIGQYGIYTTAQALDAYNKKYAYIQKGIDTDWMSIPLQNSFNHKHSLYLEGGTPNLRYGVDATFNLGGGVMKGTERNRYGAGFSLDYRVKNFQVRNYVSFAHTKGVESPYGSFSDYTCLQPYESPYDRDGLLDAKLDHSRLSDGSARGNPLYEALLGSYSWDSYDELIDNISLNWYLNDFWTIKGQFSITKKYSKSERFIDPLSSKTSVDAKVDDKTFKGDLYTGKGESLDWNTNAFLYYTRSFNKKHYLNFSAGWEASSGTTESTNAHYRGFPSGEFHSLNYAAEIYKKPTRAENTTRMVSMLASVNYTWSDIYMVDASVRFDGSSEFGANQKWAPFFSSGLGVNVHKYEFLKNNNYINKLKVRASYGRTGKVNFPAYTATTMYESLFDEWYITGFGAVLKALGNKDLTWEKTDKFNIGLETMTFNNRLTLEFEYYYNKTIDLVNDVTLSQTSGFSTYKDNMGQIANKGIELNLRADIYRDRNWTVNLWGNMAHNKNEILKISNSQKAYNERVIAFYKKEELPKVPGDNTDYSVPLPQYEEGASLTSIWAVRSLGIDPTTGKEIFLNRDGSVSDKWDATQSVVVGDTEPKCSGAFGLNLTYKNWNLFASFLYELGGQEYNKTLVSNVENADLAYSNVDLRVLTDRWKNPGDVAQFKNIKDRSLTTLPTSRFVQDKAWLKMNSLRLSYEFNREWIKKHFRMNMLRMEASTSDLINWSSIKQERGLSYPRSWKVEFALKTQF